MRVRVPPLLLLFTVHCLLFTVIGCGPTYPKERFKESIVKLCKREYKLDVKVETIGRTIAIYVPLADLIDFTFAITQEASEKINDVILSVSRVALSTDASFDFYCVVAHDIRIPEIQIVIIKSVDDVKRFLLNDISRGEYSKRMLIDLRLSPQSQKERAIKEVFSRMSLDAKWQEQVLNDFFRSEPTGLGDIGYWNERFYVKDISLAEFLAEQTGNRIKMAFKEDKTLAEKFFIRSSKGSYAARLGKKFFKISVSADDKTLGSIEGGDASREVLETALKITGEVLHSYKFEDFDHVEIVNEKTGEALNVSRENLEAFRTKKIKLKELAA